jgi:peptide/nickel transport system substrate-binding protein
MHIGKLRQFSMARFYWAIVAIALAVLTACSGSGSQSSGNTGHSGSSNTLTIAVSAATDTLNPVLGGNIDPLLIYEELAYAPLVYLKSDGSYAPGLATKWGYIGNGNLAYQITLRSRVKFSDGSQLTAAGVKTFFEYAGKNGGQEEAARVSNFSSMDVTGPLTLRLTLKQPDPTLTYAFSQPPGYVISPKGLQSPNALGTAPAGAGEYTLNSTQTVSKQTYVYDANSGYFDQSAIHWKHVIVKVLPNASAALDAVRTGQADYTIGSPREAGAATSAGLNVATGLANFGFVDLFDRTGNVVKALGDIRVRQALNYAIDRNAIVYALFGKYASPSDQILVRGADGYVNSLDSYYPYNPAKAKQLLAAAGYPNGFTLTLGAYNILPGLTDVAQAIASYWGKIGVTTAVKVPISTDDWASSVTGKKFPAAVMQYKNEPAYAITAFFQTPGEFFNPFGIVDPTINKLLQQAAGASGSQALAFYDQIQQRLVENAFYVPFASLDKIVIFRKGLQGVVVSPAAPNPNPIYFSNAG